MGRLLDAFTTFLANLALRVFYRSVDVLGAEELPRRGPLLLVSNHPNSLMDPIVLLGHLPRAPRFLAKSTLWRNPFVWPLLQLARVIPVYRRQDADGDADGARNDATFARCHAELAGGAAVALFPEGLSYHEPGLQPMKTGAARIAIGAEAAHGPIGVQVVPVGLTFEDKMRFRSRALIQVGAPIHVVDYVGPRGIEDRDAVRGLTDAIDAGLDEVTLNHASWEEAELVQQAADVFADPPSALPQRPLLSERVPLRRRVVRGYRELHARSPRALEGVVERLREYCSRLAAAGLEDRHVRADYAGAARHTGLRLSVLALLALPALVGTPINWPAYRVSGIVGGFVDRKPDLPAAYKLLSGLALFPISWIAVGWAAGAQWGSGIGWLVGLGAAPAGWAALGFWELARTLFAEARAYRALRRDPQRANELRALREELRDSVTELAKTLSESSSR